MSNSVINAFYYNGTEKINYARIQHLDNLKLNLNNKMILETGCGGKGDITKYLLKFSNNITLNDAREENILTLLKNIKKNLPYNTYNLNCDISTDTIYDIIICYGTLYHLEYPANAIKNLSNICKEFIIISTAGNGKDDGIRFLKEANENAQSYTLIGCRPGRKWMYNELNKYFKYIYFPISQPEHTDFKKDWSKPNDETCRFIIIGSHIKLDNVNLVSELPIIYN